MPTGAKIAEDILAEVPDEPADRAAERFAGPDPVAPEASIKRLDSPTDDWVREVRASLATDSHLLRINHRTHE